MTTDPLAQIKITFFQECEEQLGELEIGLLAIQEGTGDTDTVNAVFRAVHSIKGGAGAFSLDALVRFAHVFENLLDDIRSNRTEADAAVLKVLLRASDLLADLVKAAKEDAEADESKIAEISAELKSFSAAQGESEAHEEEPFSLDDLGIAPVAYSFDEPTEKTASYTIQFRPFAALYASANEVTLLFRELQRLGSIDVQLDSERLPPLDALDPEQSYLSWRVTIETSKSLSDIHEVFEFVEGNCELEISSSQTDTASSGDVSALLAQLMTNSAPQAVPEPVEIEFPELSSGDKKKDKAENPKPAAAPAAANNEAPKAGAAAMPTIRVDLDKVDHLIDLVGELVINQAMLAQRVAECGIPKASSVTVGLEELEHLTRNIQDSVMAIRAQPVKSVFQRMPRLVREVAAQVNKQVKLVTEGENTEVDKTVIEKLSDPLTHMIRNAIDHGLESTESRIAAGKPAEGTVRLAALHRSGRIVIEISDDGAGINRERVRSKAEEKGLIEQGASLSDEEIDNLIFAPGFSTAATVSDISGRGVGMDVVKRSIQALGGRISITSRPGEGSSFTMSLPLTLAVLDGMVVSVAGQTLVAPLTAIVETLQPRKNMVRTTVGGGLLLKVRDAYISLIDLGMALGFRKSPLNPTDGIVLLIDREDGVRTALLVDDILGQRQIVIKSLEGNYRQVEGIAAATILGDGRVALIVDIDALASRSQTGVKSEQLLTAVN